MTDALLLLRLEHMSTVKLLALLEREFARILAEGVADHTLLELVLAYFLGFPDECHHPKEDLIYRKMRQRDPQLAETVGDLLGEHEELAERTRSAAELARTARFDSSVTLEELVDGLREFTDFYRHHLAAEESTFFPTALSTLTRDDWAAIDFGTFDRPDPLFDEVANGRFRELRERIGAIVEERKNQLVDQE